MGGSSEHSVAVRGIARGSQPAAQPALAVGGMVVVPGRAGPVHRAGAGGRAGNG